MTPMTIDASAVGATSTPADRSWTVDDVLLYALAVGAGPDRLDLVTENATGIALRALPTLAILLSTPIPQQFDDPAQWSDLWTRVGAVEWPSVVHGAQGLTMHRPLPTSGTLTASTTVTAVWDKGRAAVLELTTDAVLAGGEPLATATATLFVRGAGGWGGDRGPSASRPEEPSASPAAQIVHATRPEQALLYRLCSDRNPLHCDPATARAAGFERPILHGLCTYAFAARAAIDVLCGGDPDALESLAGRFTAPVEPGDELTTQVWPDGKYRTIRADGTLVLEGEARPR